MSTSRTYYDINKPLSYQPNFILALGGRNIGKTYTILKHCINRKIKHNEEMIYIRRSEKELRRVKSFVFDDVKNDKAFAGYLFRYHNGIHQIAKRVPEDERPEYSTLCHLIEASKHQDYKSVPYPNVTNIVWDEYLIEDRKRTHYLDDEIGAMLSIYITVSRYRKNVRFWLIANSVDLVNPLFRYLHINNEPTFGQHIYNIGTHEQPVTLCLDMVDGSKFINQNKETIGGAIADGTKYAGMILNNRFSEAHNGFIGKKTPNAKFSYAFKYQDHVFGIWCDRSTFIYYVNDKVPCDSVIYALTLDDYELNMLAIDNARPFLRNMSRLYSSGAIRFDNATIRNDFLKLLRMLRV